MAPETARRCEEKREGRGLSPGPNGSTLQIAAVSVSGGYGLFARLQRRKGSKMNHISIAFAPCIRTKSLIPF